MRHTGSPEWFNGLNEIFGEVEHDEPIKLEANDWSDFFNEILS